MEAKNWTEVFENFNSLTALVVGDVMIDSYYWGKVERISPEAPVPVVAISEKESRLGGAANVALNLMTLGAKPIICSVIGDDEKGKEFYNLLDKRGFARDGILPSKERPTTVKTRVISDGQHILRVDEESTNDLSLAEEKAFLDHIASVFENNLVDVVIFEDYNKGVLTQNVIEKVIAMANAKDIPTSVDPKKDNFFAYKKVTLFKPNLKELREGTKIDFDKSDRNALLEAVSILEEQLEHGQTLVTLSELGVLVKNGTEVSAFPAHERKIHDVSGAGDTVISVASLCLALDLPSADIAQLSNLAGGLVCERVGVVPIDKALLLQEAQKLQ